MALFSSQIIRANLIILFIFVLTTNVDCRPGGRGKIGRVRGSSRNSIKNKFYSNSINRHALSKSNKHIMVRGATGGGAAILVGSLALRSYFSNNKKASIQSRPILANGTGSFCVNKENFSNFVIDEFRCPLSPIFTANHRYCCGAVKQQYCCSFWESGSRAIGAIVGIISACSLFFLFIICGIVYYRRHLKRKGTNGQSNMEQPAIVKRSADYIHSESPPTYSEAIRRLTEF